MPEHGAHQRLEPVLRVHARRQLGVQPREPQPHALPHRRTASSTSMRSRTRSTCVFMAQEILVSNSSYPTEPIGAQRAPHAPARARLRQPRRAADGARARLRLRRGPRVRGGDHGADDGPRLPASAEHRVAHGRVRRVRAQPRADAARDREAPRSGRQHRAPRTPSPTTWSTPRAAPGTTRSRSAATHGYRNAQATVIAPTGTISFLMDCDTTGVEPDFSLVKTKRLVGGGELTMVNGTVPRRSSGSATRRTRSSRSSRTSTRGTPSSARRSSSPRTSRSSTVDRRPRDRLHGPRHDDGRRPAVRLGRDLQDREHARVGHDRRRLEAVHRRLEAGRQGARDLPRQLQGRAAAVGQAGRARARAAAPHDADRAAGDRPQVPGRRVRGLHPRRPLPRRHARRRLRRHRQGGHDAGRPDERVHDLGLARHPVRRAARRVRLEVQPHALRAVGPDERPRHPGRQVAGRLHLPLARQEVPRRRHAGRAWASCRPRCARGCRAPTPVRETTDRRRLRAADAGLAERSRSAEVGQVARGQRALFNAWEDAQECAKCGGRKVRTGSCYTCRDCGDNCGCG